jgi:hypothetical protein
MTSFSFCGEVVYLIYLLDLVRVFALPQLRNTPGQAIKQIVLTKQRREYHFSQDTPSLLIT